MRRLLLASAVTACLASPAFAIDQAEWNHDASKAQSTIAKLKPHSENIGGGYYKADDIGIYELDLNGDGKKEIFAYTNTSFYCGTAGCNFRVYSPTKSGKLKTVMHVTTGQTIGIGDKSTNGFRDIYLQDPKSGAPIRWEFNGKEYVWADDRNAR